MNLEKIFFNTFEIKWTFVSRKENTTIVKKKKMKNDSSA